MKKLIISGVFCSVLMLGGFQVASAEETTTTSVKSQSEMLDQIKQLMKLIVDLQAKLTEVRGQVQELASDLALGAEGDDVLKAQELLASDPSIFGVKPTGYFGPLTEAAIKKFQEQYGLPVTGLLDEATREVMKELRSERKEGHVPPGFIKSAEMHDKIKARLQEKWGDCIWGEKFRASDCKKGHGDKGDDGDEDDDNASSTDATRADAVAAIEEANDVIADFMDDINQMEEDDVDQDEIDDAEDTLADAKKKLSEARRALVKGEFDEAVEKAEDAIEEITGDEDEDDDEDDEDDEDEDEDDEDDEEDDE